MHQMPPAPYVINLFGLALPGMGMIADVVQHGIDFIISEFKCAFGARITACRPAYSLCANRIRATKDLKYMIVCGRRRG